PLLRPWDLFRISCLDFRASRAPPSASQPSRASKHFDPQPDQRGTAKQDAERRENANRLARQLLHHPDADVQHAEKIKQSLLQPAVLIRPGGHEPNQPDDRTSDTEYDRDRRDVMHGGDTLHVRFRLSNVEGKDSLV